MNEQQAQLFNKRRAFFAAWKEQPLRMRTLCDLFGISRQTGYRWIRLYEADGLDGLIPSTPSVTGRRRTQTDITSAIVHLRECHGWGATRIARHLASAGLTAPSLRTINNILQRHQPPAAVPLPYQ